ncbi:alpha-1,2-fucosyltransferase [Vibrio fluvialis]|uniref:alpha-1,2-fucosyltransferase n=1 Tax=Vibrio fluvialis TaxID=676 RepID=UPI0028DF1012|nr:alpha-1,2-fucosyltransferase [Vibrio fluvialis]MDT8869695.1 alpha-1,2-fucosyltransferase [Vibrio fluvialis]MDT8877465.1 alpha-1,2-fucosyltransferase [Vibrio fluvialis]
MKERNKIIYSQGGMGNQLFQYAFYLDLKTQGYKAEFNIGRVVYDNQHGGINLNDIIEFSESSISSKNIELPWLIRDSFICKVARKISRTFGIRKIGRNFYDYDALSKYDNINVSSYNNFFGYFQFVDSAIVVKRTLEESIRKKHSDTLLKYKMKYHGCLAIHVRRGDFIASKNSLHKVYDCEFLESILSYEKNEKVVVFSDDIKWCEENLAHFDNVCFHKGTSATDDFLAMSQCEKYILFGSTFSWWAAFLFSEENNKIKVINSCPGQYCDTYSVCRLGWDFYQIPSNFNL